MDNNEQVTIKHDNDKKAPKNKTGLIVLSLILFIMIVHLFFHYCCSNNEIDNEDADKYSLQGVNAAEKGNYEEALENFNKVITLEPKNSDAWFNRGNTYLYMNELNKAITDLDRAVELDPSNIKVYLTKAVLYSKQGKHKKGIEVLSDCIKINSKGDPYLLSLCYSSRGLRYAVTGRFKEAFGDYEKSMEIYPDNPLAYFNAAKLYQKTGKNRKALELYKIAVAKFRDKKIIDESCKISPSNKILFSRFAADSEKNIKRINNKLSDSDE